MRSKHSALLGLLLVVILIWLATPPAANKRLHASPNFDSRVRLLILHATLEGDQRSLEILTHPNSKVSAHYLVPEQEPQRYWQLVDENQRAWHAGESSWRSMTALNASSIGIEVVNLGFPDADKTLPIGERRWYGYPPEQMEVLAQLIKEIAQRHQIPPQNILAHSDIAPLRKSDPGARFPWQWLHQQRQIGAWPEENSVARWRNKPMPSDALSWQQALSDYGYGLPSSGIWDETTTKVLTAFELHFNPDAVDGAPDSESWARLQALRERYPRR